MKMVQVENGKIIQYNLPRTGTLKNGSYVSGYHLLDEETLKEEGWLPLEDNPPTYDEETQYLIHDGYEIQEDKVLVKYIIENIPEVEEIPSSPNEVDILKAQNKALSDRTDFLEDVIAEMAMMIYD